MIRFDHVGDCTFPASGTCTCGANIPLLTNVEVWLDSPYHPFRRGNSYHDPGNHHRVGPRGGLHRMYHTSEADRESLASCTQIVARSRDSMLAICGKPRYQHVNEREEIR